MNLCAIILKLFNEDEKHSDQCFFALSIGMIADCRLGKWYNYKNLNFIQ